MMKYRDLKNRNHLFRVGYLLTGFLVFSLLLAACGNSTTASSTPASHPTNGKGCAKVGILLPESSTSARYDSKDKPLLTQYIKAAIPGATVDYANAEGDNAKQQAQAEADLTKGDCILVLDPHDGAAAAASVAEAKTHGVPVIAYDRLIQSKDLAYYVSFDNVRVGALQGQYIVDHYKDFVKGNSKNVVMIEGSQTDNNALLFSQGVHSKLDPLFANGTLKKVYDQFTPDWNNDTARTEMDAALTATANNVQIAYVAADGMANSVISSLKAKQLNGKVLVTGQDATVAGIQNILAGYQAMTIYKAIPKEAQATADLVKALYSGSNTSTLTNGAAVKTQDGANIPSVLETPVAVDRTNIATTVLADGFVTKVDICQGLPAGTDGIC